MMIFNVHIAVKTGRAVAVGSSALLGGTKDPRNSMSLTFDDHRS
jgi:hypothetical protein